MVENREPCSHQGSTLDAALAVVDEDGRVMSELHAGLKLPFTEPYELPLGVRGASLQPVGTGRPFGEYDRLVMHHGQDQRSAFFELSCRLAVLQPRYGWQAT